MKFKFAAVFSLLLLGACADLDNFVDSTHELANTTGGLLGGVVEKDSPAAICKARAENMLTAKHRYIGKTMQLTGKIVKIYEAPNIGMSRDPLRDTHNAVIQAGSERITAGMGSLNARTVKVGQTVSVKGRIDSIGVDDDCSIILGNSLLKPVQK